MFDLELRDLQKKYKDAIELVTAASTNLGELFSSKMVKIKNRISEYFATNDVKIETCNKEIYDLSHMFEAVQKTGANISKQEAHIYTL